MRFTSGEIKARTPRIPQISRICQKLSVIYWGRRLDIMGAEMLYNAPSAMLLESVESVASLCLSPIGLESGGKRMSRTSDCTRHGLPFLPTALSRITGLLGPQS
jgi:hypothetical protein